MTWLVTDIIFFTLTLFSTDERLSKKTDRSPLAGKEGNGSFLYISSPLHRLDTAFEMERQGIARL